MTAQNFILRSVYLTPEMDTVLRRQAFDENISKNDLIRRYLAEALKPRLEQERSVREEAFSAARAKQHTTA